MTIQPWDVVDYPFAWGTHPAVVVSNSARCGRKPEVVILACRTMRPETFREAAENEMLLDESDGLDWKTLCRCDLLFTVAKACFTRRRGTVGVERRREIGRRIVQGLAISGL
jgi:mRNA-degrading endonuclease toxin of MazEF toxin-antitoxin module